MSISWISRDQEKGVFRGAQHYICHTCNRTFGSIRKPSRLRKALWQAFVWDSVTVDMLASNEGAVRKASAVSAHLFDYGSELCRRILFLFIVFILLRSKRQNPADLQRFRYFGVFILFNVGKGFLGGSWGDIFAGQKVRAGVFLNDSLQRSPCG